jgi:hypothetical protein
MKDLRNFTGGIDFDSDPRNISNEDYISASGFASGVTKKGAIVNMLGNVKIDHTLPIGNNTVIGTLRNIKENSIIYWVFNDLGNHSILEYYCLNKEVVPILEPKPSIGFTTNFLGFALENKIHSSFLLDDILGWTDNNVSPRKINKKRAKDFLNQLTPSATNTPYDNLIATGTLNQKIQFIEFIQWKPQFIGRIEMGYDPTRNTNFLTEKMVQMKYRYIYDDNEISRWSDGTTISLPTGQENANGTITLKTDNNFVSCFVNTGHPRVKYIDVAFRFGDRGIWARLDEPIKKYNNENQRLINDYENYEINFYNDSVLVEVVDELDNADWVPQLCKTLDIVDSNRLVMANNVEGYQNPEIDATATAHRQIYNLGISTLYAGDKTPSTTLFTIAPQRVTDGGPLANPNTRDYRPVLCIPLNSSALVIGSTIVFKFRTSTVSNFSTSVDYNINFTIQDSDLVNYPNNLTNRLKQSIRDIANPVVLDSFITDYVDGSTTTQMMVIVLQEWFMSIVQYTTIENFNVIPPLSKTTSLKKGSQPIFAFLYRDIEGRDGGAVTNESMSPYVPYMPETEFKGAPVLANNAYRYRPQFEIRHRPPLWAHTYEIIYAGNNLKKYTQFILKGGQPVVLPNGNYTLDCSYIIDYITKDRIQTSVDFQFEKGDRLRFIQNAENWVSDYIECKVLDFDTATNILTVTPFDVSLVTNTMSTPRLRETVVELFSYKENIANENRPYFAIGNVFDVINPGTANRFHQGTLRNQTASQSAIVRLDFGDTYIYQRFFLNGSLAAIVESENFSDFYPSNNIGISSIYAVIPDNKTKRYEQSLRYGGRYFPNTNTNNVCRFNGSDFDVLNTMYGPINKIINIGYTLKCLQTKKNTSIYIDRTMTFNADGEQQIVLTDKVLGVKNPSELDYGCEHPESVVADDRQVYFFDVNTGSVIQDSANGMYPISDYKAKTFWRDLAEKIKNTPGIYVYGGVDNFNSYVTFTINDTNETPITEDMTLCYHEVENRWKSFQPFIPEYYGSNAMVLVSFKDGELWEHNRLDIARNNFYGVQYNSEIEVVSNIEYPKVKVFNGIAIYSNKYFYSPNIGDVSVQSNETYLQGMVSRLVKSKFRDKEGVLYADYLRDASTPNSGTQQQALLSGRKLRGEVLIQKLVNDDTDEVVLYSVIIHSVGSDMSG